MNFSLSNLFIVSEDVSVKSSNFSYTKCLSKRWNKLMHALNGNTSEVKRLPRNVNQVDYRGKRKKRRGNKRIAYRDVAKQLYGDIMYIKSQLNSEDKYIDTTSGGYTQTNTATLVLLNGLSLGTTATTRTGQSIKAVDLQYNFVLACNTAATNSYLRVIIFRDESPNTAAPTASNLLNSGGNFLSPRNVAYNERFHVFYDNLFCVCVNGPSNKVECGIKSLGFHTSFNTGDTGLISDITKNSLYVLFLRDRKSVV